METILITGGNGFIGSNFIRMLLKGGNTDYNLVNVDAFTYAGNINNLKEYLNHPNLKIYRASITRKSDLEKIFHREAPSIVVNFAAESHVDRSIEGARVFLETNILGTHNLVEVCLEHGVELFLQVSTDEVYGDLQPGDPPFTEMTPLRPNNPYSASKASADLLIRAYIRTKGLPAIITRCSNNYGPYQFPEKLIPVVISRALHNEKVPVYGRGNNIRDWIHVNDHCMGILAALKKGQPGEVYNFGGNSEVSNIDLVKLILKILDKPEDLIEFVKDRAGHDFRYAMNFSKASKELDWRPKIKFHEGLRSTVKWYVENFDWMQNVLSGAYLEDNKHAPVLKPG